MATEWSQLPKDLLELISSRLPSTDLLRFRSVCTSWRCSAPPKPRVSGGGVFKILPNDGISQTSFGFYLSKRTVFLLRLPNPGTDNPRTDYRWLLKIEEDRPHTKNLLNPLSRNKLNSRPGKLFAVDNTGRTVTVAVNAELSLAANPVFGGDKKYLVESEGELLLVDMYLSIDTGEGSLGTGEELLEQVVQYMSERTVRFKVFRLDEEGQVWDEVSSLGDRVLFLGDDSTFSANASDLLSSRGNCIFFVDNFFYSREGYASGGDDEGEEDYNGELAGREIGVFEMETGFIGPLRNYPEYAKMFWPPPCWVTSTSSEVHNRFAELSI